METKSVLTPLKDRSARGLQREELTRALDICVRKTRGNIERLAEKPEQSTWSWDKAGCYWQWKESFYAIGNWTTSFITGMALLAYKQTGDTFFLNQTNRLAPLYRLKVYEHDMDTMHDLGFLYSLYSVALYKLTGDATHRETGLRAAQVLGGRFVPKGRFIRAWGRLDSTGVDTMDDGFIPTNDMAIIDCMMNLPLLFWASAETKQQDMAAIAISHANTTLANFIRADDSLFHAFRFDLGSGNPKSPENYCGHGVDSHWARGTAWAIYGFAMAYRYTRDAKYLATSFRLARKFIANLDSEGVPVWDFKLSSGEPPLRDSSAAAVAVCGFQELEHLAAAGSIITEAKHKLLRQLCSDRYLDSDASVAGVLREGQVGRAQNVYTSWGDYFFMEALIRELGVEPEFW